MGAARRWSASVAAAAMILAINTAVAAEGTNQPSPKTDESESAHRWVGGVIGAGLFTPGEKEPLNPGERFGIGKSVLLALRVRVSRSWSVGLRTELMDLPWRTSVGTDEPLRFRKDALEARWLPRGYEPTSPYVMLLAGRTNLQWRLSSPSSSSEWRAPGLVGVGVGVEQRVTDYLQLGFELSAEFMLYEAKSESADASSAIGANTSAPSLSGSLYGVRLFAVFEPI